MRLHLPVLLSFLALLSSNTHANDTTTENENNLVIKNASKSSAEHAAGGAIDKPGEELEYKLYNSIDLTGNLLECTAEYVNDYNSFMMDAQGGAINADSVIFSGNTSINLTLNEAFSKASGMDTDTPCYPASNIYGGAIYADGIVISTTTELNILSNIVYVDYEEGFSGSGQASIYGGAFSAQTIKLTDNKEVLISENKALGYFSDSSDAATHISAYGGAIHGYTTMQGNVNITISKNVADVISGSSEGGAIHGNVDFRNNASITFSTNAAKAGSWEPYFYSYGNVGGGAIYTTGSVFMQDNTSITFDGNYAYGHEWAVGGAISGKVELLDNETITFSNNYALSEHNGTAGGAINGNLVLTGNQNVNFIGNKICIRDDRNWGSGYSAIGGAVAGGAKIQNNTSVIFDANGITLVDGDGTGGAMGTGNYTISSNKNLVFRNNYVNATSNDNYCLSCAALGGALSGQTEMKDNDSISLLNNHVSLSINESYEIEQALAVSLGGGIYAQYINFSNNGDILLQLNHAQDFMAGTARGGALALAVYNDSNYTSFGNETTSLFIRNNAGFVSEKNYTNNFGTYKLESVYLHHNSEEGEINVIFSARENKKIEFYDCIYIASDLAESCVTFNCDYITDDNKTIAQTGDIIFSGLYTEKHLREVKGGVEGTAEEIQNSRTSEVYAITNLHGGRLRVEDGAIYKGYGISAVEGSAATVRVKNAALQHEGYDLTFNSGTTLELAGTNSITGNVQMMSGSKLSFVYGETQKEQAAMTLSGSLTQGGDLAISLQGFEGQTGGYCLITLEGAEVNGWDYSSLYLTNRSREIIMPEFYLRWIDNSLYYIDYAASGNSLRWTNETGSAMWNNRDFNWSNGESQHNTCLTEVHFGANNGEQVTLDGNLLVNHMTVEQGGSYVFSESREGATLHIAGIFNVREGAFADIELSNGIRVDDSLFASGELKVNRITGKGAVNISGGSVELADDVDALAVDGRVSISQAELRGSWTGVGLSIGSSSVAAGASVTLKDVTLTSTLSNAGNLVLGGAVTVQSDSLDSTGSVTLYSAGESGYAYRVNSYTLVTGDGSTSALSGTQWVVQGDDEFPVNATYSYANGVLYATGAQDKSQYWVNGAVTFDGRSEFSTADTLVLNGGNLTMNANLGSNLTGGIRVDASGTLTLGSGVQVDCADIRGNASNRKVMLQGSGRLNLGSSADFAGYALGKNWSGTVALSNITADGSLNLTSIGQAGSVIELQNTMGYTGKQDATISADLVLKKTYAADGSEQASFQVSNGYSKPDAGYYMNTFAGKVSGDGKMVFKKSLASEYTGFAFTGNVAGWTGAFELETGKTFDLVFGGNATEINAAIRDISPSGTLNLKLGAAGAMSVNGDVVTDSITVTNDKSVSFGSSVTTGVFLAEKSCISLAAGATVAGDMSAAGLQLQAGATLDVGGVLSAGTITLQQLSAASPALTVGQFGAGDTVFQLDVDTLNALNLGHGESVTIARADQTISGGFSAWLTSAGSTSLDAAVYRYDISVENTDVVVTLDYANWGTRVWYGNTWEGMENWEDYMVCGYDAVDGVETVDLGGAEYEGSYLLVAPGKDSSTTVFRNGDLVFEAAEIADSRVELASDASLEVYGNLEASGKEVTLHGSMELMDAQIGALSGTSGTLTIVEDGMVSIGSNVTLGKLQNNGTLDIGKNKLNVAGAVTTGGNVTAGEVEVHSRANSPAKFNALVADKVTVTNTLSNYEDAISLGDGSAVGELHTEKLEVREGTVTLGYADKATQQTVQNLVVKKSASLVLNQQTELSVSNSLTAAENATVQLKQDAALNYLELSISNKHADKTVSVNAAQLAANSSELVLQDAHVKTTGSGTYELGYQLANSSVENAGSGKLQVIHEENSLEGIAAAGGDVEVYNVSAPMNLQELYIATGLSVSIMVGDVGSAMTPENEANVTVVGMAVFEQGATLNANLTLATGSTLVMDGPLHMGSTLELVAGDGTITLSGDMYDALASLELGESLTLFTGVDSLTLTNDGISVAYRPDELHGVLASDYFGNLPVPGEERYYYITYTCTGAGSGELAITLNVPEPATATLSLLALAALAARRRRKV